MTIWKLNVTLSASILIKYINLYKNIDIFQKMNKLFSLVKLSTKLGLSGVAVYTTYDLGIWGNCKQGEQVFHKLQTTQLKDVLPEEVGSQLPEMAVPEEVTNAVAIVGNVKKVSEEILDQDYNFYIAEYLELL